MWHEGYMRYMKSSHMNHRCDMRVICVTWRLQMWHEDYNVALQIRHEGHIHTVLWLGCAGMFLKYDKTSLAYTTGMVFEHWYTVTSPSKDNCTVLMSSRPSHLQNPYATVSIRIHLRITCTYVDTVSIFGLSTRILPTISANFAADV